MGVGGRAVVKRYGRRLPHRDGSKVTTEQAAGPQHWTVNVDVCFLTTAYILRIMHYTYQHTAHISTVLISYHLQSDNHFISWPKSCRYRVEVAILICKAQQSGLTRYSMLGNCKRGQLPKWKRHAGCSFKEFDKCFKTYVISFTTWWCYVWPLLIV